MAENHVPRPRPALLHFGPHDYAFVLIPPDTPGYQTFEVEMHQFMRRNCYPPASPESMESLQVVTMSNEDENEVGGRCPICLDEWKQGDVATKMPCQHRYHGHCIRDWLATCGQCPVCRYTMPLDCEYVKNKFVSYGWPRESMTDNLTRYLIMRSHLRNQIEYLDEPESDRQGRD